MLANSLAYSDTHRSAPYSLTWPYASIFILPQTTAFAVLITLKETSEQKGSSC